MTTRAVVLTALTALVCSTAAPARVVSPRARQPKAQQRLPEQRLWTDTAGVFAVERPAEGWRFTGTARAESGESIPLVALNEDTGAQFIVQHGDDVPSLKMLAGLLAQQMSNEQGVRVEDVERFPSRGGEAWGFSFTVGAEARGRVAVVRTGSHVAMAIASWPLGAPAQAAEDVASMIESLGPPPGQLPPGAF